MGLSKLSDNEIQDGLRELNGWSVQNGKLHKEIEFSNFDAAWNFMTIAVVEIQKMNHHLVCRSHLSSSFPSVLLPLFRILFS